jgi:hypothetical protein
MTYIFLLSDSVLWDITPCRPLKVNRRFGETFRLHLQARKISRTRNRRESRWQAELVSHWFLAQLVLRFSRCSAHVFFRNVGWLIKGLHGVISVITVADRKSHQSEFYFVLLLRLRGPTSRQYKLVTKIPTAQAPCLASASRRHGIPRYTVSWIPQSFSTYSWCWMWGSHVGAVLRSDAILSCRSPLTSRREVMLLLLASAMSYSSILKMEAVRTCETYRFLPDYTALHLRRSYFSLAIWYSAFRIRDHVWHPYRHLRYVVNTHRI